MYFVVSNMPHEMNGEMEINHYIIRQTKLYILKLFIWLLLVVIHDMRNGDEKVFVICILKERAGLKLMLSNFGYTLSLHFYYKWK